MNKVSSVSSVNKKMANNFCVNLKNKKSLNIIT